MEFYDVVKKRRAIRKYKPEAVPRDVILRILDAACWAPSGMNLQQWEFIVVSGGKKEQLGEPYAKAMEKIGQDWTEEQRKMALASARKFNWAPHVIVALAPKTDDAFVQKMHVESVSAAIENLLLAACAEGLGTCWAMGPLLEEEAIRSILGISSDKEIVALTPLGYPDMEATAPARKDLDSKVTWIE
jgi:nitroreductase